MRTYNSVVIVVGSLGKALDGISRLLARNNNNNNKSRRFFVVAYRLNVEKVKNVELSGADWRQLGRAIAICKTGNNISHFPTDRKPRSKVKSARKRIKKVNLIFLSPFFWLLYHSLLSWINSRLPRLFIWTGRPIDPCCYPVGGQWVKKVKAT